MTGWQRFRGPEWRAVFGLIGGGWLGGWPAVPAVGMSGLIYGMGLPWMWLLGEPYDWLFCADDPDPYCVLGALFSGPTAGTLVLWPLAGLLPLLTLALLALRARRRSAEKAPPNSSQLPATDKTAPTKRAAAGGGAPITWQSVDHAREH